MNTNASSLQDVINKFNGLFAIEIYGLPRPTWWAGEFDDEDESSATPWLTNDTGFAACFANKHEAIETCASLAGKYPNVSFRVTSI